MKFETKRLSVFAGLSLLLLACGVFQMGIEATSNRQTEAAQQTQVARSLTATRAIEAQAVTPITQPPPASTPRPTLTLSVTPLPTPILNSPTAPPGRPVELTSIHMVEVLTGWAVGKLTDGMARVLRTDDGGLTWLEVTPLESQASTQVEDLQPAAFFLDTKQAWVAWALNAQAGVVWHTRDGGQTWQASQPVEINDLYSDHFFPRALQFVDAQTGWLMVSHGVAAGSEAITLYSTTDGGSTWQWDEAAQESLFACHKTGMTFTQGAGWMTRNCPGPVDVLLNWAAPGAAWQPVTLPLPADAPYAPADVANLAGWFPKRFSPQSGLLAVEVLAFPHGQERRLNYLYATEDGGLSWRTAPLPAGSLSAMAFLDSRRGWVQVQDPAAASETERFALYRTQDGGQTWTLSAQTRWAGQFNFVNAQTGWAVAQAGEEIGLVKTETGGDFWTLEVPVVDSNQ